MNKQRTNTSAIWGFWLAITSLFIFGFLSIPGFICSCVGYSKAIKELNGAGRGMALAGIIISLIAGAFWLWIVMTFMVAVGESLNEITALSIF